MSMPILQFYKLYRKFPLLFLNYKRQFVTSATFLKDLCRKTLRNCVAKPIGIVSQNLKELRRKTLRICVVKP